MAILIKVDGSRSTVTPRKGESFTLGELQALVGGYIEHVGLPGGRHLIVDEDGEAKGYEVNFAASTEVNELLASVGSRLVGYWILGDALICEAKEVT